MKVVPTEHTINWGDYSPSAAMRQVVTEVNRQSLIQLLAELPPAHAYRRGQATFDYRVYTPYARDEVEIVYILLTGFGIPTGSPDSGIKEYITHLLLERTEQRKYALIAIGGLFVFPGTVRAKLFRQGFGALTIIADEVASLIAATFRCHTSVTISGYSLGGVLAPLVAQAIHKQGRTTIERVCCGEPNYIDRASTTLQLLQRVSHATAYRNDQIEATGIQPYIEVKKTPETKRALIAYRLRQYRPLLWRSLSMRLVAKDLALQARHYPENCKSIQMQEALGYLAKKDIPLHLLHAEHSSLCHQESFVHLAEQLYAITNKLTLTIVRGKQADHGIEEYRTLSTPFLVFGRIGQ